jgi:hypothetical protein
MKKTKQAHLWIGLICSIFILMESITGLLMNEPWLIGQSSQTEQRGNFQPGVMPGQQQGTTTNSTNSSQTTGQTQAQSGTTSQSNGNTNNQTSGTTQANSNGQAPAFGGKTGMSGGDSQSGSFMGTIKQLHAGRIGNTDITWLIDLTAIAMIFLTGSGIYLSLKVLAADRKRKRLRAEREIA